MYVLFEVRSAAVVLSYGDGVVDVEHSVPPAAYIGNGRDG